MPSTSTTIVFSFFSILLVLSFLCLNPSSPDLSSLLSKTIYLNVQRKAYDGNAHSLLVTRLYVHHKVNDLGDVSVPGEASKPVPTVEEKDVVVLTRNNFSEFIASNAYAMVKFYAPWCYWSRKLEPEYSAAATILKNTEAVLAEVDCTDELELCGDNEIQGYPSMFLFVRGTKKDVYYHDRTRDAIATWVKQKMIPQVQTVESEQDVQDILSDKWKLVFGFLNNLEDVASEELAAVRTLHNDIEFYQTTNENIARLFGVDPEINRPALFWLQREQYRMNHTLYSFDGEFTRSAISKFISVHKLPPVITFTVEKAPLVFNNTIKQLWLFTPEFSWADIFTFKEAAMALKGKLLFVQVETGRDDVGRLLCYQFGCTEDVSSVVAYSPLGSSKKHIYTGELTLSGIMSFANQFLEDKLMDKIDVKSDTFLELPNRSYTTDAAVWSDVQ